MHRGLRISPILKYLKENRPEKNIYALLDVLTEEDSLFSRHNTYGHFTASAFIVDEGRTKALAINHLVHNKWLLPGGHIEGEESALDAAIREAEEEVGLKYIKLLHPDIIDLDIHLIPENNARKEVAHWHFDVRYLFSVISDTNIIGLNRKEATEHKWVNINSLISDNKDLGNTAKNAKSILQEINQY